MDGISAVANATAIVSLAFQLTNSIKKLCDFWDSVQEAPEYIHDMRIDLELLSTVISGIALATKHELPDATLKAVLNQGMVKVGALTSVVNEIEPGFASKSYRIRKWSAVRTVFRNKRLKKLHVTLEGLKTTLILAQQNVDRQINRHQTRFLEDNFKALCSSFSTDSSKRSSERLTEVATETDQYIEALRIKILHVASSFFNPAYHNDFDSLTSRTLKGNSSELASEPNKGDTVVGAGLNDEKIAKSTSARRSNNHQTREKDLVSYQRSNSKYFFGTFYVERKVFTLQSCQSNDSAMTRAKCHYTHRTSFAFHPAWWLKKMDLDYGIRLILESSSAHGWKYTIETTCPVPDDALIFEFCREGNLAGVRSLLSRDQASVRDVDSIGRTPLYFAAGAGLPELCKFLIEAGADKWSSTYKPVDEDFFLGSPITRPISQGVSCLEIEIEDFAKVFRLFEDCIDICGERGDYWLWLWRLTQRATMLNESNTTEYPMRLWVQRCLFLEVRRKVYDGQFAWNIVINYLAGSEARKQREEALDTLLRLGSNFVDNEPKKDGYSALLICTALADSFERLLVILKRNPDLHCVGLDRDRSPHLESPTSLSLYSSWAFASWCRGLAEVGVNDDKFVREELEHAVLFNAGWKVGTLLNLFNHKFEADYVYQRHFNCDQCRRRTTTRLQPNWMQRVERIKREMEPDCEQEYDSEGSVWSNENDDMYDARSTLSEECEADRKVQKSEVNDESFDTLDQLPNAPEYYNKSERCGALPNNPVKDPSLLPEPDILNRVYDKSLIVCMACWEEHKENGYRWISKGHSGGDTLYNGEHSEDEDEETSMFFESVPR